MNKPLALIVVGSLASIATSQQPDWTVSGDVELPATTISDMAPTSRYKLTATLYGTGFDLLDTDIVAHLNVSSTTSEPTVTAEFRSLTHPDVIPAMGSHPANDFNEDLYLPAFLDCSADPCVEEYELVVTSDGASTYPPFDVSGLVTATVSGLGSQPVGTDVVVTVSGPLP